MIIRRLIVPLTVAIVTLYAGQGLAQGAFPAPLPGQPIANDPAFPPVNGAAPSASVASASGNTNSKEEWDTPYSKHPAVFQAPICGVIVL